MLRIVRLLPRKNPAFDLNLVINRDILLDSNHTMLAESDKSL